jgi:very-short-patch-repair endonuclease
MDQKPATPDLRVNPIAKRQHGVMTIRQLRAVGLTDDAVKGRVRSGRLHRLHRGVYAIGHTGISREGRWIAAVLAMGLGVKGKSECGERTAVLSYRSAAELWKLLPPRPGPVDVTVAGVAGRERRRGIRLHRSRTLAPTMITRRLGIAVTRPARTISDLREASLTGRGITISKQELRQAIRQAGVLGLRVDADEELDGTRSELEASFLRLCKQHGLPRPGVNVPVGPFLVDFVWSGHRLIVETDGYRYHSGRTAFEDDRARDLKLKSLGYEVIRLSYRQITDEPEVVARVLAPLLSRLASPTATRSM